MNSNTPDKNLQETSMVGRAILVFSMFISLASVITAMIFVGGFLIFVDHNRPLKSNPEIPGLFLVFWFFAIVFIFSTYKSVHYILTGSEVREKDRELLNRADVWFKISIIPLLLCFFIWWIELYRP